MASFWTSPIGWKCRHFDIGISWFAYFRCPLMGRSFCIQSGRIFHGSIVDIISFCCNFDAIVNLNNSNNRKWNFPSSSWAWKRAVGVNRSNRFFFRFIWIKSFLEICILSFLATGHGLNWFAFDSEISVIWKTRRGEERERERERENGDPFNHFRPFSNPNSRWPPVARWKNVNRR